VTVAVCLKCGAFKHGAFNLCRRCGYTPDDEESLTKHLLVTDHYLSQEELGAIAEKVKAGEPVEFPPETLKAAWVSKAQLDAEARKLGRGCLIGCIVAIAIAGGFLVLYVWRP
jgi:hypothetical protein